ncbi:MAG TPA: hypothetical protein VMW87_04915 [Spirochaetia bacterium]|nr:hypothetical protein [Spirochaetia bacterium]
MDLESAVENLQEIRHQLSRTSTFTGYRPLFLGSIAILAFVIALAQGVLGAARTMEAAYAEWMGIALLIVVLTVIFVFVPSLRSRYVVIRSLAFGVARQFTPFVVAGTAGTLIAYQLAPVLVTFLPATWCALFGLSIFSMQPYLPRAVAMSGIWYLGISLALAVWPPATVTGLAAGMGLAFAGGHAITAIIMRATLRLR